MVLNVTASRASIKQARLSNPASILLLSRWSNLITIIRLLAGASATFSNDMASQEQCTDVAIVYQGASSLLKPAPAYLVSHRHSLGAEDQKEEVQQIRVIARSQLMQLGDCREESPGGRPEVLH